MNLHSVRTLFVFTIIFAGGAFAGGCQRPATSRVQGYVEGEFVYVSSPLAGALQSLDVQKGLEVEAGAQLFRLEPEPERQHRDEALALLDHGRAHLADLKKGRRHTEIGALDAQLEQAHAALSFAEREAERQEKLGQTPGLTAKQDLERARTGREQARAREAELRAELATAKQGAREDQISGAEATVKSLESRLARAQWELNQKSQTAPASALVFDTLYREGEWVGAGKPVVSLLPAKNIIVRAYVPESKLGAIRLGQSARVFADGTDSSSVGNISYISPRHEYTPPVIYSKENRAKLVFRVDIAFDASTARTLHPGQPVDLSFEE